MDADKQSNPRSSSPDGEETGNRDSAPGQPGEPVEHPSAVPNYSLSPRRVGMFAVAVASASLTALVVVSSVEGADALTTIALVLAIVAFTIQIFLFVVQSQASSEQRVRSEQLNTQTRALLAEVRATAQATQAMVSQQFNQLLQAFVTGAAQTAQETKFDPVSFEQRLLSNIRAAAQPPRGSPTPSDSSALPDTDSARERQRAVLRARREQLMQARQRSERPNRLKSFPSEEQGLEAVRALNDLSSSQRARLRDLANDEVQASESGSFVGLGRDPETDSALEERGLVSQARIELGEGPFRVTRLTDDGVSTARPLSAMGNIPLWARDLDESAEDRPSDDDIPF